MAIKPFIDLTNKRKTEQLSVSLSTDAESPPLVVRKESNSNLAPSGGALSSSPTTTSAASKNSSPLSASADSIGTANKKNNDNDAAAAAAKSMSSDDIDVLDVGNKEDGETADDADAPTAGRRIRDMLSSARARVENASGRIQGYSFLLCVFMYLLLIIIIFFLKNKLAVFFIYCLARLKRSNTDSEAKVEDECE